MWGIALGPVTGMLVAQTVLEGEPPPELAPFDPLR
jgi:D-amino-acid dehydrogenase